MCGPHEGTQTVRRAAAHHHVSARVRGVRARASNNNATQRTQVERRNAPSNDPEKRHIRVLAAAPTQEVTSHKLNTSRPLLTHPFAIARTLHATYAFAYSKRACTSSTPLVSAQSHSHWHPPSSPWFRPLSHHSTLLLSRHARPTSGQRDGAVEAKLVPG